MNNTEIDKAIMNDWNRLLEMDGTISRLAVEYDRLRRRNKVAKSSTFSKCYPIKTKSKNTWLIFFSKAPADSKYKDTSSINHLSVVYYYTSVGIRAFKIIPKDDGTGCKGLSVFNSHLFKRYKERLNLSISDPIETIKHFFTNNGYFDLKKKDIPGGKTSTFAICKDGILLGEMQNQEKWVVHKTFVDTTLMFPEQTLKEKELLQNLQSAIEAELNSPDFDKNKYNYHADTMLGITGKPKSK